MKTKQHLIILLIFAFGIFIACKKSAGPGGKNEIHGTVLYKNGVSSSTEIAALAKVSIAYGTNVTTNSFDKTILANSSGHFSFEGLHKGDYFIKAEFVDSHGFKYSTKGYGISLKNKKKKIDLNIILE